MGRYLAFAARGKVAIRIGNFLLSDLLGWPLVSQSIHSTFGCRADAEQCGVRHGQPWASLPLVWSGDEVLPQGACHLASCLLARYAATLHPGPVPVTWRRGGRLLCVLNLLISSISPYFAR